MYDAIIVSTVGSFYTEKKTQSVWEITFFLDTSPMLLFLSDTRKTYQLTEIIEYTLSWRSFENTSEDIFLNVNVGAW